MNAGITSGRKAPGKSKVSGMESSPLVWWRSLSAPDFCPSAIDAMRAAIANIEMLHEPRWREAVAGDAKSAFNLVLSIDPEGPCQSRFNLAMTALVICAYGGSPAACVVVASAIGRLRRVRGKQDLADSWALRASTILAERPGLGPTG